MPAAPRTSVRPGEAVRDRQLNRAWALQPGAWLSSAVPLPSHGALHASLHLAAPVTASVEDDGTCAYGEGCCGLR